MTNKFPEATRSVLLSLDAAFILIIDAAVDHLAEACDWIQKLGNSQDSASPWHPRVHSSNPDVFSGSLVNPEFSSDIKKMVFLHHPGGQSIASEQL
jgi:hypothetical protein